MYNKTLPLIDLHRHLDGNIRPQTIWELSQQNGTELPGATLDDFTTFATIQDKANNLVEFLTKLDYGVQVLKSLDDVKRIAFENVEDLVKANIDYAELRFSPFYMAMFNQLPVEGVVEAVIDGINQGRKAFSEKTKVNLIGILSRSYGQANCTTELNALLQYRSALVGMDLAGDEKGFAGELFEQHFSRIHQAGLPVTIHAGEACGAESVWHAVKHLGAIRIGHGVNSIQDNKLIDYLAKHNIVIESCLTSNYQTGTVNDLAQHPIKQFLANDVKVCLNTDDPAVESTELIDEFNIAADIVKLSSEQISQLQLNAIDACFLSDQEKQQLRTLKTR
ncbi:adenosine deaminase [Thalassotalea sp. LPB0316]|uniref:adenosine deaminase n=1 Tax=Thalassotalea sp. LPB0316 TaxID=2769490 RepID=UPI0018695F5D|nr:adenosine deaminase [Thalassotalea sp. LPB0316]QOL24910.1 adenosine deaminase [Thalassotalea sp. LPB0316]